MWKLSQGSNKREVERRRRRWWKKKKWGALRKSLHSGIKWNERERKRKRGGVESVVVWGGGPEREKERWRGWKKRKEESETQKRNKNAKKERKREQQIGRASREVKKKRKTWDAFLSATGISSSRYGNWPKPAAPAGLFSFFLQKKRRHILSRRYTEMVLCDSFASRSGWLPVPSRRRWTLCRLS